ALDDSRSQITRISVMMRVKKSKFSLGKSLGKCIKALGGTEPGETIGEKVHLGTELLLIAAPYNRIDAVGTNDEISVAQFIEIFHDTSVNQFDANRTGTGLQ